jgi:two-component system chemotaxis sensor kinase CheA
MTLATSLAWAARLAAPQATADLYATIVALAREDSPTGRAWFFADDFGELSPVALDDEPQPSWLSEVDLTDAPEAGVGSTGAWQLVAVAADGMRLGVVAVDPGDGGEAQSVAALSTHIAHALNGAANYSMMEDLVQQEMATAVAREAAIQLILDNMTEGLLVVDLEGAATEVRSAMVETWLGPVPEEGPIWSWLADHDEGLAASFEMNFDQITWDVLPFEVCAAQMPQRLRRGDRTFGLRYTAVHEGEDLAQVVLAIADITAELKAEADAEARLEMEEIIGALLQDTRGFKDGIDELQRLVEAVREPESTVVRDRNLHTIKGNAAILGFRRFARLVHELESQLADGELWSDDLKTRLELGWNEAFTAISALITGRDEGVTIYFEELERFEASLRGGVSNAVLEQLVRSWQAPTVGSVFDRFGRVAQRLGARFGRDIQVEMKGTRIRVVGRAGEAFLSTLVHVVRNAVDHGIETTEEREAAGKPPSATLRLEAVDLGHALQLTIADDGRGIDRDKVFANARKKGLPESASLFDCLCAGSTRDEVTELSGRGVGMGALRDVLEEAGGTVSITTKAGQGTSFVFTVPNRTAGHGAVRQAS